MDLPCEKVIWNVLPTIRLSLTKKLKENGLSQREIAKNLDLTDTAISRYLHGKRGKEIKFPKDIEDLLDEIVNDILNNSGLVDKKICRVCAKIRTNKKVCTRCEIPYNETAVHISPRIFEKLEQRALAENLTVEETIKKLLEN